MPSCSLSSKLNKLTMASNEQAGESPRKGSKKRTGRSVTTESEVIEVDDTDSPSPAKRKPSRTLRSESQLQDTDKLCEFPEKTSPSVTVTLQDYKTLEHDQFLNDIIIDFYLTWLSVNILTVEDRPNVHIFSSMFYKRLITTPIKSSKAHSFEKDSSLSTPQKRHMRVKGWTKNVDLFSMDMIIIPICENSHWYLIIVIKPGLVRLPVDSEDRKLKGEPYIIVLDSMGDKKATAVKNIREYLSQEWQVKVGQHLDFSSKTMKVVRPEKPEQHNYSDCGIYLLHYVEKIFGSVAQFYWPSILTSLEDWFPLEEIAKKRDDLARLIRQLSEEQQKDALPLPWPNINFLDPKPLPRKKSKKKKESTWLPSDDDEDLGKVLETVQSDSLPGSTASFYAKKKNLRGNGDSLEGEAAGNRKVKDFSSALTELDKKVSATEKARKMRHLGRDLKAGRSVSSKSKGKDKELEEGSKVLRERMEKLKGNDAEYDKQRKMRQEKSDHKFEAMRQVNNKEDEKYNKTESYRIPKISQDKTARSSDAVTEACGGTEYFETVVQATEKVRTSKSDMESGAMDDLKMIAEELDEDKSSVTNVSNQTRTNKALKAFRNQVKVSKKNDINKSETIPEKKLNSVRKSPKKPQLGIAEILKDLEGIEDEGSDNYEDKEEEKFLEVVQSDSTVTKFLEVVKPLEKMEAIPTIPDEQKIEKKAEKILEVVKPKPSNNLIARPISVPSSPETEQINNLALGEILTVDDSPQLKQSLEVSNVKLSSDVVEIIEEDTNVDNEFALTDFLEKVPGPGVIELKTLKMSSPKLKLTLKQKVKAEKIQIDSDSSGEDPIFEKIGTRDHTSEKLHKDPSQRPLRVSDLSPKTKDSKVSRKSPPLERPRRKLVLGWQANKARQISSLEPGDLTEARKKDRFLEDFE